MINQPLLTDKVIALRRFHPRDVDALCAAARESLEDLIPWMSWAHPAYGRDEVAEFIRIVGETWEAGRYYALAVTDARDGTMLGAVSLSHIHPVYNFCNLGYWIRSSRRGNGLARLARKGHDLERPVPSHRRDDDLISHGRERQGGRQNRARPLEGQGAARGLESLGRHFDRLCARRADRHRGQFPVAAYVTGRSGDKTSVGRHEADGGSGDRSPLRIDHRAVQRHRLARVEHTNRRQRHNQNSEKPTTHRDLPPVVVFAHRTHATTPTDPS
jgi:hypothetical protein